MNLAQVYYCLTPGLSKDIWCLGRPHSLSYGPKSQVKRPVSLVIEDSRFNLINTYGHLWIQITKCVNGKTSI